MTPITKHHLVWADENHLVLNSVELVTVVVTLFGESEPPEAARVRK